MENTQEINELNYNKPKNNIYIYVLIYKVILLRAGRPGPKKPNITMRELILFHSYKRPTKKWKRWVVIPKLKKKKLKQAIYDKQV